MLQTQKRIDESLPPNIEFADENRTVSYAIFKTPEDDQCWSKRALCIYRWCKRNVNVLTFKSFEEASCMLMTKKNLWHKQNPKGSDDGVQHSESPPNNSYCGRSLRCCRSRNFVTYQLLENWGSYNAVQLATTNVYIKERPLGKQLLWRRRRRCENTKLFINLKTCIFPNIVNNIPSKFLPKSFVQTAFC
jgi:hypothetical protein